MKDNGKKRNEASGAHAHKGKKHVRGGAGTAIVTGTDAPAQKVWHTEAKENPTDQYDVFDSDLARENLENDTPEADL